MLKTAIKNGFGDWCIEGHWGRYCSRTRDTRCVGCSELRVR